MHWKQRGINVKKKKKKRLPLETHYGLANGSLDLLRLFISSNEVCNNVANFITAYEVVEVTIISLVVLPSVSNPIKLFSAESDNYYSSVCKLEFSRRQMSDI